MKPTLKVFWLLSCVNLIQGWKFLDIKKDIYVDKSVGVVDPHCTTEYDDIQCGHCETKYHLSCEKSTETVCRPTSVRVCNPEPIESCSFVKEEKCMQVPIPSCAVTWHKKCSDKLVCTKTFAVTVPAIPKFSHPKFVPDVYHEPHPYVEPGHRVVEPVPDRIVVPVPEPTVEVDAGTVDGEDADFINVNSQIGEQIARRKRSLEEVDEMEETEEYDLEEYDLEELESLPATSLSDESEENHGERHKRGAVGAALGLGLLKKKLLKKKPVKNCVTQTKCTNIPKKDCGIHTKETCIPFPKKRCETKMVERCQNIQRQECGEAVNEKCTSIPQKDCKQLVERRPRLVCPPAPTVRRISEPVFTRETPVAVAGQNYGKTISVQKTFGKTFG